MPEVIRHEPTTVKPNAGQSYDVLNLHDLNGEVIIKPNGKKFLKVENAPLLEGAPRHTIVTQFSRTKRLIEVGINAWHKQMQFAFLPYEQLAAPVQEIYLAFDKLIAHEPKERMQKFWSQIRDLICVVLQEDLPYRWRMQFISENLDKDKLRLSDSDKWWLSRQGDFNYGKS